MKLLSSFLITFLIIGKLIGQEVKLNKTGHIITNNSHSKTLEYTSSKDLPLIKYGELELKGNGLHMVKNGFLTTETYEASVPVKLRFYDTLGKNRETLSFSRIYNLKISQNGKYIAFFDTKNIISINVDDFCVHKYPKSSVFDINNTGTVIYYNENKRELSISDIYFKLTEHPIKIISDQDQQHIFTRNNLYSLNESGLVHLIELTGTFFTAKSNNSQLYFVTKQTQEGKFIFTLFTLDNNKAISEIEKTEYQRVTRSIPHDNIPSPLKYGEEYAHPIGNGYGELQDYSGSPYLHPGVDFLGEANENVYAVADGVVKAILTTGGEYNWRIAIANDDTNEESIGYLYAHLVENSFPFAVGDHVAAGDIVGNLVYWPWYEFTHIHFARIIAEGEVWDGTWWTTNNPQIDTEGLIDNSLPVFRNAKDNNLFAFKNNQGSYLAPDNLSGEIKIIASAHDLTNSNWKIDVYKLEYQIFSEDDPSAPVVEKVSFTYDFMLDTYFSNEHEGEIIQTVYSRDNTCFSIANYTQREYFQIISNTSGTEEITPEDKNVFFDTNTLPDGKYTLKVIATDASLNQAEASMGITINNTSTQANYLKERRGVNVFPNPTNSFITINNAQGATFSIVSSTGVVVKRGTITTNSHSENLNSLNNGLYYLLLETESSMKQIKLIKI